MPAAIKNLKAFDLLLLKHLVQLRLNGRYDLPISKDQIFELKQSVSFRNWLHLSPEYLIRIWNSGTGLPLNLSINTLNQLCRLVSSDYSYRLFLLKIQKIVPSSYPPNIKFEDLPKEVKESYLLLIKSLLQNQTVFNEHEILNIPLSKSEINSNNLYNESNLRSSLRTFTTILILELSNRKAGIPIDLNHDTIEDIYNSWYELFNVVRNGLKSLPSEIVFDNGHECISIANQILDSALRPHLTLYQSKFRFWLNHQKYDPINKSTTPQELQRKFPEFDPLRKSLLETNKLLQLYEKQLKICLHKFN